MPSVGGPDEYKCRGTHVIKRMKLPGTYLRIFNLFLLIKQARKRLTTTTDPNLTELLRVYLTVNNYATFREERLVSASRRVTYHSHE